MVIEAVVKAAYDAPSRPRRPAGRAVSPSDHQSASSGVPAAITALTWRPQPIDYARESRSLSLPSICTGIMTGSAEDSPASDPPGNRLDEHRREKPPFFAPPEASRSFSAGAFVLAGFCFAAIVLLVTLETSQPYLTYERPVGALLTAFLGCVVSGFLMALVVGQTRGDTPRTFWLALLGSITLSSSCLLALWGLADLVGIVFSSAEGLRNLVRGVFLVAGLLTLCFVSNTGVDLLRVIEKEVLIPWLLGAQPVGAMTAGIVVGASAVSEKTSIYLVAGFELLALMFAVGVAVYLATFGKLHEWGLLRKVARVVTVGLVATPPFFATILFFMLR